MSDPLIGERIGNYEIRKKLGQGGMGAVYEAHHLTLPGLRQAIKVIHPQYATRPEIVRRFYAEALAAARLGHPNIVKIADHGELPDGAPYMALEFLDGHGLDEEKTPMALDLALFVSVQACMGLDAAHARGIIHRDIKPANIMLVEQPSGMLRAVVCDFGIAKLQSETAVALMGGAQTNTHAVMGTPLYMSPEQARGSASVTPASDIYSMGAMLYELVCGERPYQGNTLGEIVHAHVMQPLPDPWDVRPDLPEGWRNVIRSSMAANPAERPRSAAELAELLVLATPGGEKLAQIVGFVPTGNVQLPVESHITQTPPAPPTTFSAAAAETRKLGPQRQEAARRPWALVAVIVAVLGLAGGGVAIVSRAPKEAGSASGSVGADAASAATLRERAAQRTPDAGAAAAGPAAGATPVAASIDAGLPDAAPTVVGKAHRKKKRPTRSRRKKKRRSPVSERLGPEGWGELRIKD